MMKTADQIKAEKVQELLEHIKFTEETFEGRARESRRVLMANAQEIDWMYNAIQ